MTVIRSVHDEHDAVYVERGGRELVANYGRPDRVHGAVRKSAGVIEHGVDVLAITGEDRVDFVDNAVSNRVPSTDGEGVYALLLSSSGTIETDMYVFTTEDRLLVFTPPGEGEPLATDWREKTFIQDVEIGVETDDFGVFGVYGPKATEKIASVTSTATPEEPLTFVRGSMGDAGVTVVRDDGLAGEEGYLVICAAAVAVDVFDTLENRGMNAAPFGDDTWESLTLEAGTPLFETELSGRIPNEIGIRNALDFEKGCYVGQEVVSRIENRGNPGSRLVGLASTEVPDSGAAVFDGDEAVGEVTRGAHSPSLDEPVALASLDSAAVDAEGLTVRIDGEEHPAERVELPFVDGSDRSRRLPTYQD